MTIATFLRPKLSRGTIIAANIGQAIVNLKLWLSMSSSSHRQLHGGSGLNSLSLACEPHTLPLGYHVKIWVGKCEDLGCLAVFLYDLRFLTVKYLLSLHSPNFFIKINWLTRVRTSHLLHINHVFCHCVICHLLLWYFSWILIRFNKLYGKHMHWSFVRLAIFSSEILIFTA